MSDTCWLNAPTDTYLVPPVMRCRTGQATPGGVWAWRVTGVCHSNKMQLGYAYQEVGAFIRRHGVTALTTQNTLGSTLYVELEAWSCYEITPSVRKVWRRHGSETIRREQFRILP